MTTQEIEVYLSRYAEQNFINHRAAFSNLFGYALKIGAVRENPVSKIDKPRIMRSKPPILAIEEFAALLNHAYAQGRTDVSSRLNGCPCVRESTPTRITSGRGYNEVSMSLDEILEELPKLTTEEKIRLREQLDSELSWTEEEERAIEEGIRSRAEGPSITWEELDRQIGEKYGFK